MAFALVTLVTSIAICVYILLPKRGFVFSVSAPIVFETLHDVRVDDEEVRRRMGYWLDTYRLGNQRKIESLGRCYLAAATALMLQLVLWAWALAGTIH